MSCVSACFVGDHRNLLLSLVHDFNTSTALVSTIPNIFRDACGTIDSRWQNIVHEGAGSIVPAASFSTGIAVPCSKTVVE
jgi:hypothetical protein